MLENAELYQALIMARSKHPRFAGRPAAFDRQGHGENALCGDSIDVFVQRAGTKIAHETLGCAILTASADLMAEVAAGKTPAQIAALQHAFEALVTSGAPDPALGDLNALAGVSEYRSRIRCATLPWVALSAALEEDAQHG